MANPSDDLRLTRIINNPPRGIGQKSIETARDLAIAQGTSLFDIISQARSYPELGRAAQNLTSFADMITYLRSLCATTPLDQVYDRLVELSGYADALRMKDTDENRTRLENIEELKTNITNFVKNAEEPTLEAFLAEVALYSDIDKYSEDDDCAVMMTIHSAKGLEFDTVFIVGMEDGIFPGQRALSDQEELEEERRLCYVAMTRAKKQLYITCAQRRMIFGRTSANMPSRFIEEIPAEDAEGKPQRQGYGSWRDRALEEDTYETMSFSPRTSRPASAGTYSGRSTQAPKHSFAPPPTPKAAPKAAPSPFKQGDAIVHKAFGNGVIRALTPMGSDALIEIEFESAGLKRLMLKAASQHMKLRG